MGSAGRVFMINMVLALSLVFTFKLCLFYWFGIRAPEKPRFFSQ